MTTKTKPLEDRIEKLLASGLTVEELAVKLGASAATVYRWKSEGAKRPLRALMQRLEEIERRVEGGR